MNAACCLLVTLLLSAQGAFAQSPAVVDEAERLIVLDPPSRFAESAARIRAEMQPGGRYGVIKQTDRSLVETRLDQMEVVFTRAGPAHAMSHDQRLELLERKRQIVDLLKRYDNDSLACESRPNIGCAFR
jgi:hypothetical protein